MSAPEETIDAPETGMTGFRRVLLKLSGEALMGDREYGIDPGMVEPLAREIAVVRCAGVDVAIVVGAGNFYRGLAAAAQGMERATADYAGMLATLLNALALQDAPARRGGDTKVDRPNGSRASRPRRASAIAISRRGASRSSPPTPAACAPPGEGSASVSRSTASPESSTAIPGSTRTRSSCRLHTWKRSRNSREIASASRPMASAYARMNERRKIPDGHRETSSRSSP
jgi:hypothetical protein